MKDAEKGWKMIKNEEWRLMDERKNIRFWVDIVKWFWHFQNGPSLEGLKDDISEVEGLKDDKSEVE